MGLFLFLVNKRIKDRWIPFNIKWNDSYIMDVSDDLKIRDPLQDKDFDDDRNGDGTLILQYRAFLKSIYIKLKDKKSWTKKEREAFTRVREDIKSINKIIKGRNLNNWYLHYG
jgi:hypothetical protein